MAGKRRREKRKKEKEEGLKLLIVLVVTTTTRSDYHEEGRRTIIPKNPFYSFMSNHIWERLFLSSKYYYVTNEDTYCLLRLTWRGLSGMRARPLRPAMALLASSMVDMLTKPKPLLM